MAEPLLQVEDLSVAYPPYDAERTVLRQVSLSVELGQALGIIGESGSGKSTVALAILDYLAAGGRYLDGRIRFAEKELTALTRRQKRALYGREIAYVAQDPSASLNPSLKIGTQLTEGMALHLGMDAASSRKKAVALLDEVRLRDPERLLDRYPHQLSGGMQQRVCIAMALACDPSLVILDEPTTGLDAVTETAILDLLKELKLKRRLSIILISHNLAAVAGLADAIAIMYGGMVVESGPAAPIFARPAHRYSQLLLDALPSLRAPSRALSEIPWQEASIPRTGCPFRDRCDMATTACSEEFAPAVVGDNWLTRCVRWKEVLAAGPRHVCASDAHGEHAFSAQTRPAGAGTTTAVPVLSVSGLVHSYGHKRLGRSEAEIRAVDDVSFELAEGETLGVIGESGSGKSTLARCVVGLVRPTAGSIRLAGNELTGFSRYPREVCRQIQIVFQNIAGSLHPRKTMSRVLARPYQLYEHRTPALDELQQLIASVGLKAHLLPKRAGGLSGGEKQRTALARAYAPRPSVLILDEAFSALDASMKIRVARLIRDRKQELGTSIIFITHDLPFVKYVADRLIVMYRGWVCETGHAADILSPPYHPYTETLVWSALRLEGERPATLPDSVERDSTPAGAVVKGCPFASQCPRKLGTICETQSPPVRRGAEGRQIACHIPMDDLRQMQLAEYPPIAVAKGARA